MCHRLLPTFSLASVLFAVSVFERLFPNPVPLTSSYPSARPAFHFPFQLHMLPTSFVLIPLKRLLSVSLAVTGPLTPPLSSFPLSCVMPFDCHRALWPLPQHALYPWLLPSVPPSLCCQESKCSSNPRATCFRPLLDAVICVSRFLGPFCFFLSFQRHGFLSPSLYSASLTHISCKVCVFVSERTTSTFSTRYCCGFRVTCHWMKFFFFHRRDQS